MAGPYSMDLRERVIGAVEREGLSCNQAAARFDVSQAWICIMSHHDALPAF